MRIKDSGKMVAMAAQIFNIFNSQHKNRATKSRNQKLTGSIYYKTK